ncbi:hypothetical protein FALBO_12600 [Fusarium albosuccineum]|uniref:Heterokaryon incompatibility domain-containing protein n=1 Tax=Fusarium albosuccineum TaxID=1237068 RepID=A0A8H4P651_9HYPO|nr:hypothetical protein FALBO_12600 [Fusarium albosuccineum]
MMNIYENALITFSICWDLSGVGLFSERNRGPINPQVAFLQEWAASVSNALVNTRGWVLQERILSPRIVYLGNDQLYWECNGSRAGESQPQKRYPVGGRESLQESRERLFAFSWPSLIRTYSNCDLGLERDRLNAVSGLARRFQDRIGAKYLAGIWIDFWIIDLLWQPSARWDRPPRYRRKRYSVPPTNVPSWSWAAVQGPVSLSVLPRPLTRLESAAKTFFNTDLDLSKDDEVTQRPSTPRGTRSSTPLWSCKERINRQRKPRRTRSSLELFDFSTLICSERALHVDSTIMHCLVPLALLTGTTITPPNSDPFGHFEQVTLDLRCLPIPLNFELVQDLDRLREVSGRSGGVSLAIKDFFLGTTSLDSLKMIDFGSHEGSSMAFVCFSRSWNPDLPTFFVPFFSEPIRRFRGQNPLDDNHRRPVCGLIIQEQSHSQPYPQEKNKSQVRDFIRIGTLRESTKVTCGLSPIIANTIVRQDRSLDGVNEDERWVKKAESKIGWAAKCLSFCTVQVDLFHVECFALPHFETEWTTIRLV